MNECTILIFGASGDLAKRKLIPALYKLFKSKKLEKFIIIGAAFSDATIDEIFEQARPFIADMDDELFSQMKQRAFYFRVDFGKQEDFVALNAYTQNLEKQHNLLGNRIVFFAAAAHFFCQLTEYTATSGLARRIKKTERIWNRLVYEKPFGHDLASAHKINECIAQHFEESQIYRIDHYLTKELVDNIALIRFTNCVFEPLWNNRYIDNVQIILSEQVGIEGRGAYYDTYGALKDMVQNHMLELVALLAMETPEQLAGEYIRNARAKVLENVRVVDALLGQYEGYQQEQYVRPGSKTETFAELCLRIDNPRWAGVPFYLKTGKELDKKQTVIHIKFKQVDCLLTKNCPSDSNYLTIRITPDASFALTLNVKKPGVAHQVTPVNMEFCHSCLWGAITPESYEVIFEELLRGEQSISVRVDEIESAWKVIDTIEQMNLPVYPYAKGSAGPEQAETFSKKHGMRWKS